MDQKEFWLNTGGQHSVSIIPPSKATAGEGNSVSPNAKSKPASCLLAPPVNNGPFYFDAHLLRQNITGRFRRTKP